MRNPLTPEQKQIKVINQKIRRLAKETGKNTQLYKEYVSNIKRNFDIGYTKEHNIIQIKNPKTADYNKYQKQILNRLTKMESYGDLRKTAINRLKKAGNKKPTKEEVKKDIETNDNFRQQVDETLTAIYDEILSGSLPIDIFDLYNEFKAHDTTKDKVREMVDKINEWKNVKKELQDVSYSINNNLDYVDDYMEQLMRESNGGKLTLEECKQALETLKKYYFEEREMEM